MMNDDRVARVESEVSKLRDRLDAGDRGDTLPRWVDQLLEEFKEWTQKVGELWSDYQGRKRRRRFWNSIPGRFVKLIGGISVTIGLALVILRAIKDPLWLSELCLTG